MSESLILGTNPQYPQDYEGVVETRFEVGAGDEFSVHSGYILDSSMSVTHVRNKEGATIKTIKGWRVIGQSQYDNYPLTDGIVIYINKDDYEASIEATAGNPHPLGTSYISLVLLDTYYTICEQLVQVDNVEDNQLDIHTLSDGQQGYEMRIKFSPSLQRAPDKITSVYLQDAPEAGVYSLYGQYSIISGQHQYRPVGECAWSLGHNTMAQGIFSIAQGENSSSYGHASHAEGRSCVAAGNFSHSEGESNAAIGAASHAQGYQTRAIGYASQTAGFETVAEGDYSFAAGIGTIAKHPYSVVVGEYNTGECPNSCFEVGTGSRVTRATGFYVSRDGLCYAPNATIGNIEAQSGKALVTKEYVLNKASNYLPIETIEDYIIETGILSSSLDTALKPSTGDCWVDVDWAYEKYKSGRLKLYAVSAFWGIPLTTAWGVVYESPQLAVPKPQFDPSSNIEIDYCISDSRVIDSSVGSRIEVLYSSAAIQFETSGAYTPWNNGGNNQNYWSFYVYRPLRTNTIDFRLRFCIEARWRQKEE